MRVWDLAMRVWDLAMRVWDLAMRGWDLGMREWDLAMRGWDLGMRGWDLAMRGWDLGMRARDLGIREWDLGSLFSRLRPAFHCLQYGKARRAWYLFSSEYDVFTKFAELTGCVSCIFNRLHAQHLVCKTVASC